MITLEKVYNKILDIEKILNDQYQAKNQNEPKKFIYEPAISEEDYNQLILFINAAGHDKEIKEKDINVINDYIKYLCDHGSKMFDCDPDVFINYITSIYDDDVFGNNNIKQIENKISLILHSLNVHFERETGKETTKEVDEMEYKSKIHLLNLQYNKNK